MNIENHPEGKEGKDYQVEMKISPQCTFHQLALEAYVDLLKLKNYSENTIRNYRNWFLLFLHRFPDRKPSEIKKSEIMDFMKKYYR